MQLCCTFRRIQLFTFVVATCIITTILVILFAFNYPTFARHRVIDAILFKNGSDSMERFLTTTDLKNLRLSFFIYNVTNPDEVLNSGAKINLEEIGPFVYSEYKYKEFVNNNQTSGLITFALKRRYILDRSLSVADPQKVYITWPNVPLIVARAVLDKLPFIARSAAYLIINNAIKNRKEPAFINDTVENFIFDGSKRDLFQYLQSLDKLKLIKPWPLKDNRFALLYGRNDTWNPDIDRLMTVSAGFGLNQTYADLNQYKYINGSSTLPFWQSQPPECNIVGGTDGEFFSPFINQKQKLQIYSIDICRKMTFSFRQKSYINGISTLHYTLDKSSLQSGQKNPENQCYCMARSLDGTIKPECELDGLMDLSTCVQPNIVASGSHFIYGSPELLDRITGLTPPDDNLHEPTVMVEPNTGLSAKVRVPIQFNVRLEKGGFLLFNFFKDNSPLFIPLLTAVESAELTAEQANQLRNELILLDSWLVTMVLGGAIVFIVAIVVSTAVILIKFRDSRRTTDSSEREPLISARTEETTSAYTDRVEGSGQANESANNYHTL